MDGVHSRLAIFTRPSITTGLSGRARKGCAMWLVGLELGLVAALLAIVALALRSPPKNDTDDTPDD
ncbi:hypothetical protein [Zoogloea sp.]|jgi:hypothetical protein|uniref:hypothetical protein n=1 Tax=Zoogloea sp. TaxID=49181 RepID=UPI0035B22BA2